MVAKDGNICIWPISGGEIGEITMERVPGPVKAVTAAALESTAVVLVATESAVHCVRTIDGSTAALSILIQPQPAQVKLGLSAIL